MKKPIEVHKVHTFSGHKDCLYTLQPFTDRTFFSAGGDGMVVLWDLTQPEKGTMIAKVPASIYAMYFEKESSQLIIGQNFEGIHIIDMNSREEVGSLKFTEDAIFDIKADQHLIYVATGGGEVIVIDRKNLSIVQRIDEGTKNARTIALNDKWFVVGYSDNHIRVFEKKSLKKVKDIIAHKISVFSLVFHPDMDVLVSGSRDAHLKFWSLPDFSLESGFAAHMYAINHIEFSPDKQHFVTCSMDKSIKVWDAQTFKLKKVIDKSRHAGHGTSVNKLLWLPHQNQLVSCSDDRTISVWNLNFGE